MQPLYAACSRYLGVWVSVGFRQKGHPRVTIIIQICCISESEILFSTGSHECLGGSSGADGGQFHHEKVLSTVIIFLSGAQRQIGGSFIRKK